MKTIAENTYDFERLRKIGAVYVDKTGMLKVDKPVKLAIEQIREKNYTLPYQVGESPLYAIGLSFDSETRNVKDMHVERVR